MSLKHSSQLPFLDVALLRKAAFEAASTSSSTGEAAQKKSELMRKVSDFVNSAFEDAIREHKLHADQASKLSDLAYGMEHVYLKCLTVMKAGKPEYVKFKTGITKRRIVAVLKDETMEIEAWFWEEKGDALKKGDIIAILDASVRKLGSGYALSIGNKSTVLFEIGGKSV